MSDSKLTAVNIHALAEAAATAKQLLEISDDGTTDLHKDTAADIHEALVNLGLTESEKSEPMTCEYTFYHEDFSKAVAVAMRILRKVRGGYLDNTRNNYGNCLTRTTSHQDEAMKDGYTLAQLFLTITRPDDINEKPIAYLTDKYDDVKDGVLKRDEEVQP